MTRNEWFPFASLIISIIVATSFLTLECSRNKDNRDELQKLRTKNMQIQHQLDSLHNQVALKDNLLVSEIDSLYVVLHHLNERKSYTNSHMRRVKERLQIEQERRRAIMKSQKIQ